MADMEEFHLKGTNIHHFSCTHGLDACFVQHSFFGQIEFNKSFGERSRVDRNIYFFQDVRYRPHMIHVAVGDDNTSHQVLVFLNVFEIRDDVINSRHIMIGEHDACVYDENVLSIFVDHHVFPDFPQTT